MTCAIYARVSTNDQHVENQLQELRQYVGRRGWTAVEYVDEGVSGAKERRPALDEMLRAAKRRKFDVLLGRLPERVAKIRLESKLQPSRREARGPPWEPGAVVHSLCACPYRPNRVRGSIN